MSSSSGSVSGSSSEKKRRINLLGDMAQKLYENLIQWIYNRKKSGGTMGGTTLREYNNSSNNKKQ